MLTRKQIVSAWTILSGLFRDMLNDPNVELYREIHNQAILAIDLKAEVDRLSAQLEKVRKMSLVTGLSSRPQSYIEAIDAIYKMLYRPDLTSGELTGHGGVT